MSELIQAISETVVDGVVGNLKCTNLPDPDAITYYEFEKERKIYLETDVDASLMPIQRMIMRWNMEDLKSGTKNPKPIWIYIMSLGGSIDYMWTLIDTIEASRTPVYTVDLGEAGSAAGLIFMSGHKRFMMKNATVIVHEGSAEFGGDAIKVQDAADSYKQMIKAMKDYILKKTNIPKTQLSKKRANDWTLDSKYCLENGVCDKVVEHLEEII